MKKVNVSILEYFKMIMDFDNDSEEFKKVTEKEFKEELEKALGVKIKWVS